MRGTAARYLLSNPFEEECFNPGKDEVPFDQFTQFARTSEVPKLWDEDAMRDSYTYSLGEGKQRFKSCGQFNNVLQLLLHSLSVARALDRTLVLPGFYFRKGLRRTRIDHFEEEWYPTGHFINTSRLAEAGYKTIEMEDFKRQQWQKQKLDVEAVVAEAGAGGWQAAPLTLPRVYIRALGEQGPRLDNFGDFGLTFAEEKPVEFPFAFQQQSAPRWVDSSTEAHNGRYRPTPGNRSVLQIQQLTPDSRSMDDRLIPQSRYSIWQAGEIERWWHGTTETSELAYPPVLAFDSAVSFGFGMDGLRFDPALAELNGALGYVDQVGTKARRFIQQEFGEEDYLAVQKRLS